MRMIDLQVVSAVQYIMYQKTDVEGYEYQDTQVQTVQLGGMKFQFYLL